MELNAVVDEMDALVSKGAIVEAAERYIAPSGVTTDFDGTVTRSREQMVAKMRGFRDAIARVNEIQRHGVLSGGDVTMSEYTFDFDMKDGSHVLWHEIIRREWRNGLVVAEQYFKA